MKLLLFFLSLAALVAVAGLSGQKESRLLLLDWASKNPAGRPPLAVLIEMGLRDTSPTPWSNRAVVTGARVVHREGYRFRQGDHLTAGAGWVASSHRALRVPPGNPALARMAGIA